MLGRLRDTYRGLAIFGAVGGLGLAAVSGLMFAFRLQCEPLLRLALMALVPRRARYHYQPADYYFWAWVVFGLAVVWAMIVGITALQKPATDRRIDANLRAKLRQTSRGAPLEPE